MMPFTAAKLGAVQGSAIVIVGERWGAESCPVVLALRQERWGAESALPMGARGSDSDSGNHGSNPGPSATKPLDTTAYFRFLWSPDVPIFPRVSSPAKASTPTRDAKCLGAGRERPSRLAVYIPR